MHLSETPDQSQSTVVFTPQLAFFLAAMLVSLKAYGPDPLVVISEMESPPEVSVATLSSS